MLRILSLADFDHVTQVCTGNMPLWLTMRRIELEYINFKYMSFVRRTTRRLKYSVHNKYIMSLLYKKIFEG